jgi:hypothetical protein
MTNDTNEPPTTVVTFEAYPLMYQIINFSINEERGRDENWDWARDRYTVRVSPTVLAMAENEMARMEADGEWNWLDVEFEEAIPKYPLLRFAWDIICHAHDMVALELAGREPSAYVWWAFMREDEDQYYVTATHLAHNLYSALGYFQELGFFRGNEPMEPRGGHTMDIGEGKSRVVVARWDRRDEADSY